MLSKPRDTKPVFIDHFLSMLGSSMFDSETATSSRHGGASHAKTTRALVVAPTGFSGPPPPPSFTLNDFVFSVFCDSMRSELITPINKKYKIVFLTCIPKEYPVRIASLVHFLDLLGTSLGSIVMMGSSCLGVKVDLMKASDSVN